VDLRAHLMRSLYTGSASLKLLHKDIVHSSIEEL
jgi:hypothetical protein